MKTYQSIKTQQKAGLVSLDETHATVMTDNGETKTFTISTFNRWWKEVEGEEFNAPEAAAPQEAIPAAEVAQEQEAAEAAPEGAAKPKKEKKESAKKPKEEKAKKRGSAGDHPLRAVIEDYAVAQGHTIFQGQVTGFRSVKVDGRMYMAFNFNQQGVTLQLRSAAVEGMVEYKKINHMFDARVTLRDETAETVELIKKLMDASLHYQLNKPSKKKSTATASAES